MTAFMTRWDQASRLAAIASSGLTETCLRNSRALRRSEKDQHYQFLGNVKEAVLGIGFDENNASTAHRLLFGAHLHARASPDHVIQFIFFVRMLRIHRSRGKDVHAGA